jgi:hypothetical protein
MEDRKDLLTLLLDVLESKERDHVERAIRETTNKKYARLRREPVTEPVS